MGKEMDYSFIPKPELLPDGGVRIRLPDKPEWLAAGGVVKEEVSSHSGLNIRDDWRERLGGWLSKWQERTNQPGKAPVGFTRAYKELANREGLGFGVDYLNLDDIEDSLRKGNPGITKEDIGWAIKFIRPMLENKPWSLKVVEMLRPDQVEKEEE